MKECDKIENMKSSTKIEGAFCSPFLFKLDWNLTIYAWQTYIGCLVVGLVVGNYQVYTYLTTFNNLEDFMHITGTVIALSFSIFGIYPECIGYRKTL